MSPFGPLYFCHQAFHSRLCTYCYWTLKWNFYCFLKAFTTSHYHTITAHRRPPKDHFKGAKLKMVFYMLGAWSAVNMVSDKWLNFYAKVSSLTWSLWLAERNTLIKVFAILALQTDRYSCRLLNQSPPMTDVRQVILPQLSPQQQWSGENYQQTSITHPCRKILIGFGAAGAVQHSH